MGHVIYCLYHVIAYAVREHPLKRHNFEQILKMVKLLYDLMQAQKSYKYSNNFNKKIENGYFQ